MTTYLLDVNLLLALSDPMHTHHLLAPEGRHVYRTDATH